MSLDESFPALDPMVTRRMCRGICKSIPKPMRQRNSHYMFGDKFCKKCDRFFFANPDILCKCCGMKLRSSKRGRHSKVELEPISIPVSDATLDKLKKIETEEDYNAIFVMQGNLS
jgi:hypothetical protein